MKMVFLCMKHRTKLVESPQYADAMWNRLMLLAREKFDQMAWNDMFLMHGNAFEVATILLRHESASNDSVERYVRTATEFAYSLRKSTYPSDLPLFIAMVKDALKEHGAQQPLDTLLTPLTDVAFTPLNEVDLWMHTLFAAGANAEQTRH